MQKHKDLRIYALLVKLDLTSSRSHFDMAWQNCGKNVLLEKILWCLAGEKMGSHHFKIYFIFVWGPPISKITPLSLFLEYELAAKMWVS